MNNHPIPLRSSPREWSIVTGFTLIELMIALVIVAVLAAIAYPSYIHYVTRSRRIAAEACLSNYANYLERFYTTNMRYDQDTNGTPMNSAALTALQLDCATTANTGLYYAYTFAANSPTRSTYMLQAVPQGIQATRDTACGTLTLDQTGQRGVTGTAGVEQCW